MKSLVITKDLKGKARRAMSQTRLVQCPPFVRVQFWCTTTNYAHYTTRELRFMVYEYDRAEFEAITRFSFNGAVYMSDKKIRRQRIDAIGVRAFCDTARNEKSYKWYNTFDSYMKQCLSIHDVKYVQLNKGDFLLISISSLEVKSLSDLNVKNVFDSMIKNILDWRFKPLPDWADSNEDYFFCSFQTIYHLLKVVPSFGKLIERARDEHVNNNKRSTLSR